jgi:hypothetical protein
MPEFDEKPPGIPSQPDPLFDEFWAAYPRKVSKKMAYRYWQVMRRRRVDLRMVIDAADRFRIECAARGTEKDFIPHPSSWLAKERYLGEEEPRGLSPAILPASAAPAVHFNDEQLIAAVVRLTAEQDRPVTAAKEIIALILRRSPAAPVPVFPAVDADRVRVLAGMPYPDYLLTPEWEARKRIMRAQCGQRCQVCNGPDRLHVHHRTYDRRGMENPSDLIVLCENCHDLFHANRKLVRGTAD